MRRVLLLTALALTTSLVAAGSAAQASAPVHETVPIDETFTQSDCGFDIVEHDAFTLRLITWLDAAGDPLRQNVLASNAKITYTNADTGASVTAANPFAVHKTFNPDGSVTIAFTGLSFSIHGERHYVNSGREVIVFSETDGVTLVSSAGPSDDLCAALTDAIGS